MGDPALPQLGDEVQIEASTPSVTSPGSRRSSDLPSMLS